jgi:hypothetical protein
MSDSNLLPQFHLLLGEASAADEASEMFDLDSTDKASVETWNRLKAEEVKAKRALIEYIQTNPEVLPQILSLMPLTSR